MTGMLVDVAEDRVLGKPWSPRRRTAVGLFTLSGGSMGGVVAPPTVWALQSSQKARGLDGPESWVHLTTYGAWDGHPAGHFEFTLDMFENLIARFDAQVNALPWTIGHPWGTEPAPAWLRQLAVKGDGTEEHDGLYGLTEWTLPVAAEIRNGGWRYCSVVIDLAAVDRVTGAEVGPELLEVGLTNKPFVDGQKPIECQRSKGPTQMAKPMDPKAIKALLDSIASDLGLPEGATKEKISSMINALFGILDGTAADASPDAEAAMGKMDPAACALVAKQIVTLGKGLMARGALKFDDGPQWTSGGTTPGGSGAGDDGGGTPDDGSDADAAGAALLQALAADGVDLAALAAYVAANPGALSAMISVPSDQASLERNPLVKKLSAELHATKAGQAALVATVKTLTAESESRRLAAEKVAKDAATAEVETLIADALKTGRIALATDDAGKPVQSDHEKALRAVIALDLAGGKAMLASLPELVPSGTVAGAGSSTAPKPRPRAAPIDGDVVGFDFSPKDGAETAIMNANHRDPAKARRLLERYRANKSEQSAA